VLAQLHALSHFVVEDAKSARAWLKRCAWPKPLPEALMLVWDEHTAQSLHQSDAAIRQVLAWLEAGESVGLLSEAGLPAIADPGQALIAAVHAAGFPVRPQVGPSSLMLALMASGLSGQHFEFKGYLAAAVDARDAALLAMERLNAQDGRSLLWIETPYRNEAMMASIKRVLKINTLVCVACALGTEKEAIQVKTVAQWRQSAWMPGREPCVFILGSAMQTILHRAPDSPVEGASDRPGQTLSKNHPFREIRLAQPARPRQDLKPRRRKHP
jgi:16S rRNA (cytidine1402-2'-O)-methyltransferase